VLLSTPHALRAQLVMDARTAVRMAPARVDRPDARGQHRVGLASRTERLRTPLLDPGPEVLLGDSEQD